MRMTCAEARTRLQDLRDTGQAPDEEIAAHLAGCTGCAAFGTFLEGLSGRAREALDAAAAGLPRPDYPGIFARAAEERERAAFAARRSRLTFASAAAVLVAGIGIAAGVRAWTGRRDGNMVIAHVNGFVDELFAEPLLADAGFPVDVQVSGFRDWLEDPSASILP
jgi:predicted anti-sigma-YlaC factor YlaD